MSSQKHTPVKPPQNWAHDRDGGGGRGGDGGGGDGGGFEGVAREAVAVEEDVLK